VQSRYTQTLYDKKYHRHPLNKFSQFYTLIKQSEHTNKTNLVFFLSNFFFIKERKRKNREHIKKREKVGNKREGRKLKERKRKIKQGKKKLFK
jgi:hypothetical protein